MTAKRARLVKARKADIWRTRRWAERKVVPQMAAMFSLPPEDVLYHTLCMLEASGFNTGHDLAEKKDRGRV